ncbi:MAG: flavin reductase family protein [Rikenellaceae bacterium]
MEQMINKDFCWDDNFTKIQVKDLKENTIKLISEDWMLVGAGTKEKFNALTASWGAIGFIWNKPTLTAYIRDNRYTYEFMQQSNNFTVSILEDGLKDAMMICGRESGRDSNKIQKAGLKPVLTPSENVSYEQAKVVIECRKLFVSEISLDSLVCEDKEDIKNAFYVKDSALHQQFIAEITALWIKKD